MDVAHGMDARRRGRLRQPIVVGIGLGTQFGPQPQSPQVVLGDAPRGGDLEIALETLPSGTAMADRIVPMLTFRDGAGRYCREFEVIGDLPDELEFGVACRTPRNTWHVEIIVAAPIVEPDDSGFAPASGPGADALAAMLDALGASPPLSPETEAEAIKDGWETR